VKLGPSYEGKNRMLRRIFGPKRQGVVEGWRKLHNCVLHQILLE